MDDYSSVAMVWLIENGEEMRAYWAGLGDWVPSPVGAIQFRRRRDAEAAIEALEMEGCTAVEKMVRK